MRVVITGATGLLGGSLLADLRRNPRYELTAVSRRSRISDRVRWVTSDLLRLHDCRTVVQDADVIVHMTHDGSPLAPLGAVPGTGCAGSLPTMNLLRAIAECGTRPRFIYPSSGGAVYGAAASGRPFTEDDACRPLNAYGALKVAIEQQLRAASDRGELSAVVLRISNAYGQLLPPERSQGLIGTTMSRLAAGLPVRLIGNPDNIRDYVHVSDVSDAVERAICHPGPYSVFNVGSGHGHSVRDVVAIMEHLWGRPLARVEVEHPEARRLTTHCVLDIERARQTLHWQPGVPLSEGLNRMLALARARMPVLAPPCDSMV